MRRKTKEALITALMLTTFTVSMSFLAGCGQIQAQIDDLKKHDDLQDSRLTDLEKRVQALEGSMNAVMSDIGAKELVIEDMQSQIDILNTTIAHSTGVTGALQSQLDSLVLSQADLVSAVNSLQVQNALTLSQIAALQLNVQIQEIVDPCGDLAGHYDEVGLRTSDGRYLFYFEDGSGHRHLTVLTEGVWYQTSDSQQCRFKVLNGKLTY